MIISWKAQYYDFGARGFKDRYLILDTASLRSELRYKLELLFEIEDQRDHSPIVQYRHLFREASEAEFVALFHDKQDFPKQVFLLEYYEDQDGILLDRRRMGEALTGQPNAIAFPSHFRAHDIAYQFADKSIQVDFSNIHLPEKDLRSLSVFLRDVAELKNSRFRNEGPGRLTVRGHHPPEVLTSTTTDDIRSFVLVFRRLYAESEPGNFVKATGQVFARYCKHPAADWVTGERKEYTKQLFSPLGRSLPIPKGISFSRKQLIDGFLYTRFIHQPQADARNDYAHCLAEIGDAVTLQWIFYATIYELSNSYIGVAGPIEWFYREYCKVHSPAPDPHDQPLGTATGIGSLRTKEENVAAARETKAKEIAVRLWDEAGKPSGGPGQFEQAAWELLRP